MSLEILIVSAFFKPEAIYLRPIYPRELLYGALIKAPGRAGTVGLTWGDYCSQNRILT